MPTLSTWVLGTTWLIVGLSKPTFGAVAAISMFVRVRGFARFSCDRILESYEWFDGEDPSINCEAVNRHNRLRRI
jgi:hypothetical protein